MNKHKLREPLIPDFTSRESLKDEFWWAMVDEHVPRPMPLNDVKELPDSFVYVRKYGFFPLAWGCHPAILSLFLAWDLGYYEAHRLLDFDRVKHLGFKEWHDMENFADYYLKNTIGTCYRSTLSDKIYVGKKSNLNEDETDMFYPLEVL